MCTVRIAKETINAFENKRWWGDANTSHGYGHPDIKNLPGGSDCNPIRFESVVEVANNGHIIHAGVDNDEMFDEEDGLLDEACSMLESDEYDNVLDMACATTEAESVEDLFNDSFDISMLEDMDAENTTLSQASNIISPENERSANLKRKTDIIPHKNFKKANLN